MIDIVQRIIHEAVAAADILIAHGKRTIHHDAVAGVEEVSHYETIREYPNGGKDVKKVVDVKAVPAQDAYDEEVEVQRYICYTTEELAAQEKARKEAEEKAQLPTAEERLAALEAAMLDLLAAQ